MALQEGFQAYKFAGGIETKMDSKAVPAARLLGLENGVFSKAISIKKRNGYSLLSKAIDGGGVIEDARSLAARGNEMLKFTGNRCYSRQDDNDQWSDSGAALVAVGRDRAAVHTSSQQTMPDHASAGGATVYAWEDSLGGVWWTVVDTASGAIHRAPTQADALGERPRCVVVGGVLHIYYAVPTQTRVMAIVVNPSTPSADVTPITLISDLRTDNPVYDACPTTRDGTPALIAWHEHGSSNLRVGYVTGGALLGSPGNGHPSVATVASLLTIATPLAVAFKYVDGADDDRLFVGYALDAVGNGGNILTLSGGTTSTPVGTTVNTATSVYPTAASVQRIALTVAGEYVWAAFEETAAETSQHFTVVNSLLDAVAGTERTLRSVGLASRAFQVGDDAYAVFVHDTVYFNVYLTLRLSDFAPVGRHLAGTAGGLPTRTHLSSAHVIDDVVYVTLPYLNRVASKENDKFTEKALRQISMDFSDTDVRQTAQIGESLYMAGAIPQHYDGRLWFEQGYNMGPELITPVSAAGGSMTVSSTYLYIVWYEWTDAQGEIHRGPTSPGTEVITGGADTQVTLTLPTLRVTRKENVRICVARSLPGETSGLFRASSLDPTTVGAVNGYIANTTSADTVTFIDRMSDADLRKQERLYITGGILSNDAASVGAIMVAGKNRIFFSDTAADSVVRFSQRIATGYGLEIAPENAHDIPPEGGPITALGIMGSTVCVFKRAKIFVFNGDGPLENGSSATTGFAKAEAVPGNIGCVDPGSVVDVPAGLMFKSESGIYLLKRDYTLEYVGAPAELYNTQTIRRAYSMPGRSQTLFLTSSGKSLLYDYLFGQWSTFTNHEGLDAVVVDGVYHYLRNDGSVYRETIGQFTDAGSRITLRFETAWLHLLEHLQGFQRFWVLKLLGTWISKHQLGIQYRTNYDESWSDPSWLDATGDLLSAGWLTGEGCSEIGIDPITGTVYGEDTYGYGPYGGQGPDVYEWKMGVHENGESIQFRFEDFEKDGLAGASFELTEMLITGGIKAATSRPTSGARST